MERNEQLGDVVERTVFAPVDCLTSATHPTPETFPAARPAAIVKVRVESTSKRGLTLQLSGKLVDIGSTIGATSDWKYDLEFVDPSVQEIGEVLAESFIETMKVECRRKLEDPGNILICKVLMATGIRYTFTTDKRLSLDASASVLKQKLSAEGADTSVADGSITVTAPPGQKFMLGYLAWKMSAGAPGSKGQGGVLSVSETEDLKRSVLGR